MKKQSIPYLFMRGGTSRGPYFNRVDLPENRNELSETLIKVIGAGHYLNIDGIGGGNAVTTKVAMLSPSLKNDCDIDYFFAQVSVEEKLVDYKPTCGNILSGVGPAAIEMGLVKPQNNQTEIIIHAVNTGAKVKAIVQTNKDGVIYKGNSAIDGVPGTNAPIGLHFMDIVGSKTGKLFPTGQKSDIISNISVTCIDVTMPMVIAKASDLNISGYESAEELNDNKELFQKIENLRIIAGKKMGMGDVTKSVTPKFALLAPAQNNGHIAARYFMPWKAHPTMAVTGAQAIASCLMAKGTIADNLLNRPSVNPVDLILEHPLGSINVLLDYTNDNDVFFVNAAGLTRTARKIADGNLFL